MATTGDDVTVVVVDDERPLAALVARYLQREGYHVHQAHDGDEALEVIGRVDPDVIVLDLMLPGVDGLEIARRVRENADPYILMLTARTDEVDRIVGLRVGADDYVTKPFSPNEIVARIQAMLRRPRRATTQAGSIRTVGELTVDPDAREVTVADHAVELTKLEFDLLAALASEPRRVFSKQQLLDQVWGSSDFRDEHVVAVHIANLRRKLADAGGDAGYVRTVRGVGYRLVDP